MPKQRFSTCLLLLLIPIGLLLLIPSLWVFVSVTAKPIHPIPDTLPSTTQSAPSPDAAAAVEKARQIVRASVAAQNLPGASVAVGINGNLVWAEGFGFADIRTSVPVTPNHRFRIGTASAMLTSAAAGLLLEKGRLNLDSEIQTYVPSFPKKQWPVTLRQLMSHTAGLPTGEGPLRRQHCEHPAEALQYFAQSPLLFQPGTQYRYSDYGWIVASAAIEAAAGQPFLTYMHDQVFGPLGMNGTVPDPGPDPAEVEGEDFPLFIMIRELIYDPGAIRDPAATSTKNPPGDNVTPYATRFRSDPKYGVHMTRITDYSCYAGAGVFLSTPSDLVRFAMALNSGKLLKPATVELLQTSQQLASGQPTGYGLGWQRKTITLAGKPTTAIGHDGDSLGGTVASLITFPEYGIVVAVTSNISHAGTFTLATKIAEAFAGQPPTPARK